MKHWLIKNEILLLVCALVIGGTLSVVGRFRTPGRLTVLEAQAMDMSAMRPPAGAALVQLATVRRGSIDDTVTYTGTVQAYNEQDVSARITGTIVSLPVYPGDTVRAGQLLAQLDTAEISAKTAQAQADAQSAQNAAVVAELTHHVHHGFALQQADAQQNAAQAALADARAEADSAQDGIADAQAAAQSAKASASYWSTEIAREKSLADAGAVSRQEYQDELAQSQAASAAVLSANAKVREARAMAAAGVDKVDQARNQLTAAIQDRKMAAADIAIAQEQAQQAGASAMSAQDAARQAQVVEGYARITSPANGVVTDRPIAPGTLVQPGSTILKIAEIDQVRVQANVAVVDLGGIRTGSPVEISPQGGDGRSISAKVTAVFPAASDDMRTAVVEAVIPNPGHRLLPGGFATMKIARSLRTDKLLVPAESVITQNGQNFLWAAQASGGRMYEAVICHTKYTAAQAKRYHYICPMDGGKLVPIGASSTNQTPQVHEIPVQIGASDGTWTEILPGSVSEGDRVVRKGQAGLTDGANVISVAWGAAGPLAIPYAAQASAGQVVYRCEKCGMTYSAADAKRDRYIDPMDGGRLLPVRPKSSMAGMKM